MERRGSRPLTHSSPTLIAMQSGHLPYSVNIPLVNFESTHTLSLIVSSLPAEKVSTAEF